MDRCAPSYSNSTISCFTKEALLDIVKSYNKSHPDPIRVNKGDDKRDLWEAIQLKLRDQCGNDEACWLEQPFLRKNPDLDKYFKPLAPLGQYQWLATDDIYRVMNQWSEKYPRFKFVGPLPMDFLRLHDPESKFLQRLNLHRTKEYDNIGIILNIDPSTKGGSHWVAMNIDLRKKEIHYFDSYGDKHYSNNKYMIPYRDSYGQSHQKDKIAMPMELQNFINRITDNGQKKKVGGGPPGYKVKINTIRHQFANSECGIYSMLFLIKSLSSSFEEITQDIVMDEKANQYRDILFRRR